jgi:hypothetical protein
MNSAGWEKMIAPAELPVLQGRTPADQAPSLSQRERLAVEYARLVSSTPLHFPSSFIAELKQQFSEREIVILATWFVFVTVYRLPFASKSSMRG